MSKAREFKLWRREHKDSWLVCPGEYDTSNLGTAETIHVIEYSEVERLKSEKQKLKNCISLAQDLMTHPFLYSEQALRNESLNVRWYNLYKAIEELGVE